MFVSTLKLVRVVALVSMIVTSEGSLPGGFIRASNIQGDQHFYDELGRVRIFHGGNRVKKVCCIIVITVPQSGFSQAFPWYFSNMVDSRSEMQLMQAMGFNAIRSLALYT